MRARLCVRLCVYVCVCVLCVGVVALEFNRKVSMASE